MNTLLLYPKFPDTFWSLSHVLDVIGADVAFPPLGLLTVASLLPDDWESRLVDANIRDISPAEAEWADVAFISGMAVQRRSARDLIETCRCFDLPVVAGGPLFTCEHENFEGVDHFVLDEAEVSLQSFVEDFEAGEADRMYRASDFPDMTESPIPRWDLLEMDHYGAMSLQVSRGCPYNCEFCNVTALFGRRPRVKTADQVIAELERLRRLGWGGNVFFADDNLIGHRRYAKNELLPALVDWQKRRGAFSFLTQASINMADDDELLEMMADAGFRTVFVGIETPDEESLEACNKKHNVGRNLLEDVKKIHRAGITVQAGFIVGFDGDTPEAFERQEEFIEQSGIVSAMVGLLQAPPGTDLRERMKKEGRLRGELSGDNVDGTTNIEPTMGLQTLKAGYRKLMDKLYSAGPFYRRVRRFLSDYELPGVDVELDAPTLKAFARSLYVLGVKDEGRAEFWRLLGWVLSRDPRKLPEAIKQSIFGYHFRRVCENRILDPAR